jgi:ADP-L-glycero-D-manno-heptose 6-epimerase
MIVVTGTAGFIGSCVAKYLHEQGRDDIVLVDDFSNQNKLANLTTIESLEKINRDEFFDWVIDKSIDSIIHVGARTDTTEFDYSIFQRLNVDYSKRIWHLAAERSIPLVYASSAATYGAGELGYRDDHEIVSDLKPLNPYGKSKNVFDQWVLDNDSLPHWYGLKFFNVYGPNEYHKGRMASVVYHAFNQIKATGGMKLFKSHNSAYADGEQLRDFIYVKDICRVIAFLIDRLPNSGIYNLGSGKARTFLDLTNAVFNAMDLDPKISFIDTPVDIRDTYQYYTQADMTKLASAGYSESFQELEHGVNDYVMKYLRQSRYF